VIKRAHWRDERRTAAALLEAMDAVPPPEAAELQRLDEAQRGDAPPEDPWRSD
jgi:hypothetical protein